MRQKPGVAEKLKMTKGDPVLLRNGWSLIGKKCPSNAGLIALHTQWKVADNFF